MKVIKFEICEKCPFCREDDGGGHCSSFTMCDKFGIMLHDWEVDSADFDVTSGIHPDCQLEDT